MVHPEAWLKPLAAGLYCEPGGFFVDPTRAVERAVITHAHSDHARRGHRHVLASAATLALMRARGIAPASGEVAGWGERVRVGDVTLWLAPAGHVLGSAQVVIEYGGQRVVVSGDYKRRRDASCESFVPVICDVFVTEATFALPVFVHPAAPGEIARLLASVALYPGRAHAIGCYSLGKTQRLIMLLRTAGWERPIWLDRALLPMCEVYQAMGIELGALRPLAEAGEATLAGEIVLAPPPRLAALGLADPVLCAASGWMGVRRRARQSGAELPLVISDHADWPELLATCGEVGAPEIWITHGPEPALVHALAARGVRGRALRLIGAGG